MWSWGLSLLAILGLWLNWQIGNGHRWPWLISAAFGLPWIAYAVATTQWGFIATTALSITINLRNWRKHELPEHPAVAE